MKKRNNVLYTHNMHEYTAADMNEWKNKMKKVKTKYNTDNYHVIEEQFLIRKKRKKN